MAVSWLVSSDLLVLEQNSNLLDKTWREVQAAQVLNWTNLHQPVTGFPVQSRNEAIHLRPRRGK